MFLFGLFSSHIPYIVIIAVYMLYFVTYSVNKLQGYGKPVSHEIEDNHNTLSLDKTSDKTIDYYDAESDDEVLKSRSDNKLHLLFGLSLNRFIIPEFKVSPCFFCNVLIPRAPPSGL